MGRYGPKEWSVTTLTDKHTRIEPAILYFGTPVVLISTMNENGTPNLAPMSSAFWLGWRAMLGLGGRSKTAQNLLRTRECVLNLPSDALAPAVDKLALTTGSDPVPPGKHERGYRFVPGKFGRAGLTPVPSQTVRPPRVAECPVSMEAVVEASHPVGDGAGRWPSRYGCSGSGCTTRSAPRARTTTSTRTRGDR